jgi:hypothetical protein
LPETDGLEDLPHVVNVHRTRELNLNQTANASPQTRGITVNHDLHRRSRSRTAIAVAMLAALTLTACAGQEKPAAAPAKTTAPSPSPTPTQEPTPVGPEPVIGQIPPAQWQRMKDAHIVRPGCPISRPEQARRVEINYVNFEGQTRRGELIVNADVAESVVRIFSTLYEAEYPIRKMKPVETYGADSDKSLRADNTSALNCRRADQTNAPFLKSPHANGRAIDINPRENPWKDPRCTCWSPSAEFGKNRHGPGVIVKGGVVWNAFDAEGWIWQDIDVPDYMHFDTGYPSVRFAPKG